MNEALSMTLPRTFAGLAQLSERAGQALAEAAVDAKTAYAVQVVIEELVSNIIRHGQGGDAGPDGDIQVLMAIDSAAVQLHLADSGPAFDPAAAPEPELDVPLEARQVGGLGLHLVRSMTEHLTYERVNGQNRVNARIARQVGVQADQ